MKSSLTHAPQQIPNIIHQSELSGPEACRWSDRSLQDYPCILLSFSPVATSLSPPLNHSGSSLCITNSKRLHSLRPLHGVLPDGISLVYDVSVIYINQKKLTGILERSQIFLMRQILFFFCCEINAAMKGKSEANLACHALYESWHISTRVFYNAFGSALANGIHHGLNIKTVVCSRRPFQL